MSEPAEQIELNQPEPAPSRARSTLLKRLADVVCLPSSRVNAFERAMTADLLVEMLREASESERERVARRLTGLVEAPGPLLRTLLRDQIEVAQHLLTECPHLNDVDLVDCVRTATPEHRRLIAQRRGLSETVSDSIIEFEEPSVIETLLRNEQARISHAGMESIVAGTRSDAHLVPVLLKRRELRPSHAYVLFWWADSEARRTILQRFAVTREILQEAAGDVFAIAATEGWQDPLARKALQFIERRQRNRAALEKSQFDSLESAVAAAQTGMSRELAEEISYLSGLKPMTGAKIFTDQGGESLAILCKSTGLPRAAIRAIWRGLRRAETDESGAIAPGLARALNTFDIIAVDKAQTVLRYWNWSLSSALTPVLLRAIREGDEGGIDQFSVPQRTAMLALSDELGR